MKHWIYTASAALIAAVLITASPAQAIPVAHTIDFDIGNDGSVDFMGSFEVEDTALVPNTEIGPAGIQNWSVTFAGATWESPFTLDFDSRLDFDLIEVVILYVDSNGDIDDIFALISDTSLPGQTESQLVMQAGDLDAPGGGHST